METVQKREASRIKASAPSSSGATSAIRIRPPQPSYSLLKASKSGRRRYSAFCAPYFFIEKKGPSMFIPISREQPSGRFACSAAAVA